LDGAARGGRVAGGADPAPPAEFSPRFTVSARSLQEWEKGRRRPESAVRAYLTVINRNPEAVERALTNKS
jgi:putative transcriptional regulator